MTGGPERRAEVAATLRRAAWRVRRGFTTRCLARDVDGDPVGPLDPAAVAWCAEGAIAAEAPDPALARAAILAVRETVLLGRMRLADWNDDRARDEEDVATLLERAARWLDTDLASA